MLGSIKHGKIALAIHDGFRVGQFADEETTARAIANRIADVLSVEPDFDRQAFLKIAMPRED